MDNNLMFKKFEVIGKTKDDAKNAAAPFNLRGEATMKYKKWAESNVVTEASLKEWMKEYLASKKWTCENDAAYIVTQAGSPDTRKRPYTEIKHEYKDRTHTPKLAYMIVDENDKEVARESTAKAARQTAKELVTLNKQTYKIIKGAYIKEGNSLYMTVKYTPSANQKDYKLLVFGYTSAD